MVRTVVVSLAVAVVVSVAVLVITMSLVVTVLVPGPVVVSTNVVDESGKVLVPSDDTKPVVVSRIVVLTPGREVVSGSVFVAEATI